MYLNEKNYKTYFLITLIIILCYNNELSDYLKKTIMMNIPKNVNVLFLYVSP